MANLPPYVDIPHVSRKYPNFSGDNPNSACTVRVWTSGNMEVWTCFASIHPHADGGRHGLSLHSYPNPVSGFDIRRRSIPKPDLPELRRGASARSLNVQR